LQKSLQKQPTLNSLQKQPNLAKIGKTGTSNIATTTNPTNNRRIVISPEPDSNGGAKHERDSNGGAKHEREQINSNGGANANDEGKENGEDDDRPRMTNANNKYEG